MTAQPARKLATYADLAALPDHVVGEILNGQLYLQSRPRPIHAKAETSIGGDLDGTFGRRTDDPQRPGGWLILVEPELVLGQQVIVPDLAGWTRERMPNLPTTPQFHLAPDWVCEIVSPATARKDRVIKLPMYAAEGVRWAWLVDPDTRTVEAFANEAGRWMLLGNWVGDDAARIPPFEAAEFAMLNWWDGEAAEM